MAAAPIRGRLTVLRPAGEDDADLLVAWHADDEVARYWDGKMFTRETMLVRLSRARVNPYVIEMDEVPVGYLQVHDLDADGDGGLDMFLVPGARGRGLGSDAARAMARHLLDDCGWTRVTVDPYTRNETAVRGWRNAGFVEISEHEADDEHLQSWVLMEFRG